MSVIKSPALHFLFIGGLIFTVYVLRNGNEPWDERTQIVIPRYRIDLALNEFAGKVGRQPTPEEESNVIETVVNQEVLFQYALDLGLHREKVTEERLAQIASFVEENPHEPKTKSERAQEALDLGLHHGDMVVRRILIDGSSRLIRAPVLLRIPDEEMMEAYYRENQDAFRLPAETRITHVLVNSLKYGDGTESRADELLNKIRTENISPDEAVKLEGGAFVSPSLPSLPDKEIDRLFGHRFVKNLALAPEGEWSGPIPSRYGLHLVYVHGRKEPAVPPLEDVRAKVRRRLIHKLADEWLALRLQQLRQEYDVIIEGAPSS
jgi:hypothetical protein